MKYYIILFISIFISGCSNLEKSPFITRVEEFSISECKKDCGIDSIGIKKNLIKDGNLHIKLGHIVNCSWHDGYLKDIFKRKDTLFIELDRPHITDTLSIDSLTIETSESYVHTDCDCFFYFDLTIDDVDQAPKTIQMFPTYRDENHWGYLNKKRIQIITTEKETK